MYEITKVTMRPVRAPRHGLDHAVAVRIEIRGLTPAIPWVAWVDGVPLQFVEVDVKRGVLEGLAVTALDTAAVEVGRPGANRIRLEAFETRQSISCQD
jgi:hypothetical protein